jgi:hypothetical protein
MGIDVSGQEQKDTPHPEERPLGRVSKDEVDGAAILRDTSLRDAPQDEA